MIDNIDSIKEILKKNNLRITQSRLAVSSILLEAGGRPLTPEEIFSKIQVSSKYNCDQVSVYRVLATFDELKLVMKSSFYGEASRYVLCESKKDHQHYFKCYSCNLIEPLKGCVVTRKEKELEEVGYKNLRHHLEIVGLCPSCASS
tara:strand:+ start:326 stop:763 length:438 start_codon:yes stop_codon:yes gene_type:complete